MIMISKTHGWKSKRRRRREGIYTVVCSLFLFKKQGVVSWESLRWRMNRGDIWYWWMEMLGLLSSANLVCISWLVVKQTHIRQSRISSWQPRKVWLHLTIDLHRFMYSTVPLDNFSLIISHARDLKSKVTLRFAPRGIYICTQVRPCPVLYVLYV